MTGLVHSHPSIRAGWTLPAPPPGFDLPVVTLDPRGEAMGLDFYRVDGYVLASEVPGSDVHLPRWPWIDGFDPTAEDWERIGFLVWK